jgi:hypothetical protein
MHPPATATAAASDSETLSLKRLNDCFAMLVILTELMVIGASRLAEPN